MFTPLERDVLEYAEAMTNTPPTVTDELSTGLLEQLGPTAMVELTASIAFANLCSILFGSARNRVSEPIGWSRRAAIFAGAPDPALSRPRRQEQYGARNHHAGFFAACEVPLASRPERVRV